MSVETFGFDEFIKRLGELEGDFEREATSLLETTGNLAVAEAQARTPVGVGTPSPGTLRRSIQRSDVVNLEVEVGSDENIAPYGEYVEDGTRYMRPRYMLRDGVKIAEKYFIKESGNMFKKFTRGLKL